MKRFSTTILTLSALLIMLAVSCGGGGGNGEPVEVTGRYDLGLRGEGGLRGIGELRLRSDGGVVGEGQLGDGTAAFDFSVDGSRDGDTFSGTVNITGGPDGNFEVECARSGSGSECSGDELEILGGHVTLEDEQDGPRQAALIVRKQPETENGEDGNGDNGESENAETSQDGDGEEPELSGRLVQYIERLSPDEFGVGIAHSDPTFSSIAVVADFTSDPPLTSFYTLSGQVSEGEMTDGSVSPFGSFSSAGMMVGAEDSEGNLFGQVVIEGGIGTGWFAQDLEQFSPAFPPVDGGPGVSRSLDLSVTLLSSDEKVSGQARGYLRFNSKFTGAGSLLTSGGNVRMFTLLGERPGAGDIDSTLRLQQGGSLNFTGTQRPASHFIFRAQDPSLTVFAVTRNSLTHSESSEFHRIHTHPGDSADKFGAGFLDVETTGSPPHSVTGIYFTDSREGEELREFTTIGETAETGEGWDYSGSLFTVSSPQRNRGDFSASQQGELTAAPLSGTYSVNQEGDTGFNGLSFSD